MKKNDSPPPQVLVRERLRTCECDLNGGQKTKDRTTQGKIAAAARMSATQYGNFRHVSAPKSPSLSYAVCLAHALRVPLETLPDPGSEYAVHVRDDVTWRLCGHARGAREEARRQAAAGVLQGESPEKIRARLRELFQGRGTPVPQLSEASLRAMAEGGLGLELVEIVLSESGEEVLDEKLARALAKALEKECPEGRAPEVHVVRDLAHPEFHSDPVAPLLVALVAHRRVAGFLAEHETSYRIGLAGGAHCATFARATGRASSPFPDPCGDKQLTFVPLTLEPFADHQLALADAVVARMADRAGMLLGPERVEARTFQSFGYVEHGKVDQLDTNSIELVRDHYGRLDVAIYGCGDLEHDGWLSRTLDRVGVAPARASTDVCLNLLTEDAEPIELPEGRQFIGVGLGHIRRLVASEDKLAVLLTSGPAKGVPLCVVARAGCADVIVCDQAAARAALGAIGR